MKKTAVWLGSTTLVLCTLAAIGGLAFYKYNQVQASIMPPPPEQPISVVVDVATELSFRQQTTMIGTILSPRSIMLSNEVPGTVSAIHFVPGQIVKQGKLLVELDTSVERAQLDAAKARRDIAESVYKRTSEAAATQAVTPSELDEATAQLAQAKAEVEELQAVIQRKTLTAPFGAKIGLADTHVGQFLPSGSQIASLQSIDDFVFVDFMIPQSAADSVCPGQEVQLLAQGRSMTGEVLAVDSQADRQSRNLMARARLDRKRELSKPEWLVPGGSVKVIIEYGPQQTTAAIPVEALQTTPTQTFVYVVTHKDGALRAYERQVVAGPSFGNKLTIYSGVEVGEQVVADGSFKFHDGALVQHVDEDDDASENSAASQEHQTTPAVD